MCDDLRILNDVELTAVSGGMMANKGNYESQLKSPGSLPQTGNVGESSQLIGGGVLGLIIGGVVLGVVA